MKLCWTVALIICLIQDALLPVGAVSWTYHAWSRNDSSKVSTDIWQLPVDEAEATKVLCSRLSSVSRSHSLRALSVSGFHPAVQSLCIRSGLVCVQSGGPASQAGIGAGDHPSVVRLFPEPQLMGRLIYDIAKWFHWSSFVVIYELDIELTKYHGIMSLVSEPIIFRQINTSGRLEAALSVLLSIRQANVKNIVLDVSDRALASVFTLAGIANCTRPDYNYLHVGSLNESVFMSEVRSHMLAGVNATNVDVSLSSEQRWLMGASLIDETHLNLTVPLNGTADTAGAELLMESGGDCAIIKPAGRSTFHLFRSKIERNNGLINAFNGPLINFSFYLSKMLPQSLVRISTWSFGHGFKLLNSSSSLNRSAPNKLLLPKRNLSIVASEFPPFVLYQTRSADSDNAPLFGNDRWTGLAIELIGKIAELNYWNFTIHNSFDNTFGSKKIRPDGKAEWGGMIGELTRGMADIAVGSITASKERSEVVDFAMPFMSAGYAVLMKKSSASQSLFQFLDPFHRDVWLCILLSVLVFSLCIFITGRFSPNQVSSTKEEDSATDGRENGFSMLNSVWFSVSSVLQQGPELNPRAPSTRISAAVWWFFVLVVISSYTANLTAFLTLNSFDRISTVSQLARQDEVKFTTMSRDSAYEFFKSTTDPIYKEMFRKMELWNSTGQVYYFGVGDSLYGELSRINDHAFILEAPAVEYLKERMCDLTQVGDSFNTFYYSFAVAKGDYELRNQISDSILQLQSDPFYMDLIRRWMKIYNTTNGLPCSELQTNTGPQVLLLEQFRGLFFILGSGLVLALVVMGVEILVVAVRNQRLSKEI